MIRRLSLVLILAAAVAAFAQPMRFNLSLRDEASARAFKIEIDAHLLGLELGLTF